MSTYFENGISYNTTTRAVIYSDAQKTGKQGTDGKQLTTESDPATLVTSAPWAYWGDNNDEPALITDDIKNCGVLSAGVEAEARLAVGKCIDPFLLVDKKPDGTEELEWVGDSEILDFLEANESYQYSYSNIYNLLGYGPSATQFILNRGRDKINRFEATDIYKARFQKRDENGVINNMYLCGDWAAAPSQPDGSKIKTIPLLRERYELQQLQESTKGYEFAVLHRLLKNGAAYYPTPPHRSSKAWVSISRSIPNIKMAMNKNQMIIKYLVTIADTYWKRIHKKWDTYPPAKRDEEIKKVHDSINKWLTGELNAGKSIIAGKGYDPTSQQFVDDITILVIDDKMKDGKMLPDGAAADKQILFSMFFNPAIWGGNLLGDGASGGAGSGSDIREATLVLMNLLNPEREMNLKIFNLVKNFNGWRRLEVERDVFATTAAPQNNQRSKKIKPRLVFRYSSAILTTLDQGGSQKPVTN